MQKECIKSERTVSQDGDGVWRPLSAREGGTRVDFDRLHEGVPQWLGQSLWDLLVDGLYLHDAEDAHSYLPVANDDLVTAGLKQIERELRLQLDWRSTRLAVASLRERCFQSAEVFLDVVDWALKVRTLDVNATEMVLRQAGSAWMVHGPSRDRLAKRVATTVAEAGKKTASVANRAGHHLDRAWAFVYGRVPDPSSGYREAVKAVEAAAKPVLAPQDDSATLGKMVGSFDQVRGRLITVLAPAPPLDPLDVVKGMCQLLWKAQLDRHGTDVQEAPLAVGQSEAEAALHLATTLVQWFTSGLVRRA